MSGAPAAREVWFTNRKGYVKKVYVREEDWGGTSFQVPIAYSKWSAAKPPKEYSVTRTQLSATAPDPSAPPPKAAAGEDAKPGPRPEGVQFMVQKQYFWAIKNGEKRWEGRLKNGSAAAVRVGDVLIFNRTLRKICAEVRSFPSFRAMLETIGLLNLLPGVQAVEEGVAIYRAFPKYEELEARDGAVAFRLEDAPEAEGTAEAATAGSPAAKRMKMDMAEISDDDAPLM